MNMPGGPEIVVIILVALIVLGPQQLPKAMRTFGSVMGEIRKVSGGFQAEMRNAMNTLTDETESAAKPAPKPVVDEVKAGTAPAPEVETAVAAETEVAPEPTAAEAVGEPAAEPRPAIDPADRAAG